MAAHSPGPALGAGTLTDCTGEGRGWCGHQIGATRTDRMAALRPTGVDSVRRALPAAGSADVARAYTFAPVGQFQNVRVGQGLARIAVAGAPVFLHGAPGKFIVFGDAFI